MKKLISIAVFLLMFISTANASPCPLPCSANTDADIQFQGFEWYTDYPTTLKAAHERGLSDKWYNDFSTMISVRRRTGRLYIPVLAVLLEAKQSVEDM